MQNAEIFRGVKPKLGKDCWIAPGASVIGALVFFPELLP